MQESDFLSLHADDGHTTAGVPGLRRRIYANYAGMVYVRYEHD